MSVSTSITEAGFPLVKAWILTAACFVVGAGIGSTGTLVFDGSAADASSGGANENLEWLRSVCSSAPIEELIKRRAPLYMELIRGRDDDLLWRGADRLIAFALERPATDERRGIADELSRILRSSNARLCEPRRASLDALEGIAKVREGVNHPGGSTAPQAVGDDLAWLQPLCDDSSPIEELIRRRGSLYFAVVRPNVDPIIWHGVERVCREVQVNPDLKDRRDIAAELVDLLSGNAITPESPTKGVLLLRHRPTLQAIAEGR